MLSAYPACFIKEENGYSVIFPDLNNLAICGHTLDEAFFMADDCLAGYLYWLQEDNEIAPEPSPIDKININEFTGRTVKAPDEAFVNIIIVDVAEYAKTHFGEFGKKMITIPAWLNKVALEQNINFSEVFQDALKRQFDFEQELNEN